jgi:hypothetical protein
MTYNFLTTWTALHHSGQFPTNIFKILFLPTERSNNPVQYSDMYFQGQQEDPSFVSVALGEFTSVKSGTCICSFDSTGLHYAIASADVSRLTVHI